MEFDGKKQVILANRNIVSPTSRHVKEQHQAEATAVTRQLVGQGGCREDGLGARDDHLEAVETNAGGDARLQRRCGLRGLPPPVIPMPSHEHCVVS